MWFKQIQIFQLTDALRYSPDELIEKLQPLAFTSCLPSFHSSMGWASPFDDDNGPLVHGVNGYMMICLQIEEKILPATVIRQELNEKIKQIEMDQDRKVRQREKLSLKDEVVLTLLPRAFTKITRIHAYIDTKNQWLVLNTANAAKTEQFISLFKKSISENVHSFALKKLAPIFTHWLKTKDYPHTFSIEKSCVLQDPDQQSRIIRCQHQDLFANGIQAFLKEGCDAKQLALAWHDQVKFVLADDFTLRSVQYEDDVLSQADAMDIETKNQQFDADFVIMTETLSKMLTDLLDLFIDVEKSAKTPEQVAAQA